MEYPCIGCPDKYYCDKLCPQALRYKNLRDNQTFTDKNSITKIIKLK